MGDEKQLPPTSFFSRELLSEDEEELRFYSQPLIEEHTKFEYLPAKPVDNGSNQSVTDVEKEEPFR